MPGECVAIRIADGSLVEVEDGDIKRLCDALWALTSRPGAVAIVGLLEHERRRPPAARAEIKLNERESVILRAAQTTMAH